MKYIIGYPNKLCGVALEENIKNYTFSSYFQLFPRLIYTLTVVKIVQVFFTFLLQPITSSLRSGSPYFYKMAANSNDV